MSSNILIIGATGNIGKELVKLLVKNGENIRVMARPTSNTKELNALGVDLFNGDMGDTDSLKGAMNGIDKVFFATPLVPNMVQLSSNIIDAAKDCGVSHLIKISGAGAESEGITLTKWHRAIEKEMEQSGMAYTFLRPNSFMQNYANYSSHTIIDHGAFYAPMGEGQAAFIDARDIANVAYHVITDEGHQNKAYYLSGPKALSNYEIADILSSVTGKMIRYVDVPANDARQSMLTTGMPEIIVDAKMELYQINKLGYASEVSFTVEQITGHKANSFEVFANYYKGVFIK
jgi:uncharacterized protein YbjT (DUF2867 family)